MSGVFRGYVIGALARNGLSVIITFCFGINGSKCSLSLLTHRDKFGKQGFYVTFYNTLNPSRNGDFKTADLTEYLERSDNDFQYMIKTYEITDNMKHHAKTVSDFLP